jgi:hypothetical protein
LRPRDVIFSMTPRDVPLGSVAPEAAMIPSPSRSAAARQVRAGAKVKDPGFGRVQGPGIPPGHGFGLDPAVFRVFGIAFLRCVCSGRGYCTTFFRVC